MAKLSIQDIDLTNKRVFIRVDFNVPLTEDGQTITDDTRIVATLPTIEYALRHRAKVILASHLGRPKGKPNPKYSLRPVAIRLRELLDKKFSDSVNVAFSPDCVGEIAEEMARQLESGQVLLLENLRFHAEEEANDPAFSKALASLAEVYVNDAFGSAHRAHASTEGITHYLKPAVAGLLMEKEITYLGKALESPEKPFVAIIGGSKISGKIDVIQNLLDKVDTLVIVGGMAYTFYRALGVKTAKSLVEEDKIELAKETLVKARVKGVKLLLPMDNVIADSFANDAKTQVWDSSKDFPENWQGLDIGPLVGCRDREGSFNRQDHRVERPCRRLRISALCRGHQRHRARRRGQSRGHLDHRRRRFGKRHQPGRRSRPDHAHLHRRRSFAGVPRRQEAARRGSADRQVAPATQLNGLRRGIRAVAPTSPASARS